MLPMAMDILLHLPKAGKTYLYEHKMKKTLIEGKTIQGIGFNKNDGEVLEYENCHFKNCDFSEADLSGCIFTDCRFDTCNLSLAKLDKTALRTVHFTHCKMLALRFDSCNSFGLELGFENCRLDHSSFYGTKIKKTVFLNSQLVECDFAECDLSGSVFSNCDLTGTLFENTILEYTDFRTAFNFTLNPEMNRVKKAKFSLAGLPGLLSHLPIEIE